MVNKQYFYVLIILLLSAIGCRQRKNNSDGVFEPKSQSEKVSTDSTADTSGMVRFIGGSFIMGSDNGLANEKPAHQVIIESFYMDKTPVTVGAFRMFIQQTGYATDAETFGDAGVFNFEQNQWELVPGATWEHPFGPNGPMAENNHPVTQVSWNDATAYAEWAGKRLPTEAEWEYAARCGGKNMARFSWGNELIMHGKYQANLWQGTHLTDHQGADGFVFTSPVGYYGMTACGLSDMGGNVWNWCSDIYQAYPGSQYQFQTDANVRVIRGGSFFFDANGAYSYSVVGRSMNSAETSLFNTGFRCARSE